MKRVKITGGWLKLDDDVELSKVRDFSWHVTHCGATTTVYVDGKPNKLLFHRWLLNVPDDMVVEWADGNKLNCQRSNMRIVKRAGRRNRKGASKYKGVSRFRHKWQALICHQGSRKHLGYFKKDRNAALAYDKAAIELHGSFALTNKKLKLL